MKYTQNESCNYDSNAAGKNIDNNNHNNDVVVTTATVGVVSPNSADDAAATAMDVEQILTKIFQKMDERNTAMKNALDSITRTNERLDAMLDDPLIQAIQAARASRRQSQL